MQLIFCVILAPAMLVYWMYSICREYRKYQEKHKGYDK